MTRRTSLPGVATGLRARKTMPKWLTRFLSPCVLGSSSLGATNPDRKPDNCPWHRKMMPDSPSSAAVATPALSVSRSREQSSRQRNGLTSDSISSQNRRLIVVENGNGSIGNALGCIIVSHAGISQSFPPVVGRGVIKSDNVGNRPG